MTKEKEEAASAYLQKVFEQEEAVEDSLLRPVEEVMEQVKHRLSFEP